MITQWVLFKVRTECHFLHNIALNHLKVKLLLMCQFYRKSCSFQIIANFLLNVWSISVNKLKTTWIFQSANICEEDHSHCSEMERKREELKVRNTLLILFMTFDRMTVCEQSESKQGRSNIYWLLLQYIFVQSQLIMNPFKHKNPMNSS